MRTGYGYGTRAFRGIVLVTLSVVALMGVAYAAQFSHMTHEQIEKQLTCRACHERDALGIVPEKGVCKACHSVDELGEIELGKVETHGSFWFKEHKVFARMKAGGNRITQCSECHNESFCNDCHNGGFREATSDARIHSSDYRITHPIIAKRDQRSCASCHETSFCNDCHNRFDRNILRLESHRRGWSDITVGSTPTRHETFSETQCQGCHVDGMLPEHEWSERHGREARRDLMLCKSCHEDADVCMKCHSARRGLRINPHPVGWGKINDRYNQASDGEVCAKCH